MGVSTWGQQYGPGQGAGTVVPVDLATRPPVPDRPALGPSPIFGAEGGPPRKPPTNRLALASLLCGLVGGWGVSVVLAIVALRQIPRRRERGEHLAVIALVLSALWGVVGLCLLAGSYGVHQDLPAGPAPGQVNSMDLRVGDCFDKPAASTSLYVTAVRCAQPHDAEVLLRIDLPDLTYPGVSAFRELSGECADHREDVLDPNLNYPGLDIRYLYPAAQSWNAGQRSMVCFFRADSGRLTGPVGASGRALTADQQRYVDAVTYYNQLMGEIDTDPPPAWTDLRVLAGQMRQVESTELARLTARPWPADVQVLVDALVAQDRVELPYWQQAATATTEDTVDRAVDEAMQHSGNDEATAVRTALHLANG